MTQDELADVVGSVREVVSRALKDFRAQGLIGISNSWIIIVDEKRLREESVCKALK